MDQGLDGREYHSVRYRRSTVPKQTARRVSPRFGKASILRSDLRDVGSNSRAALGKCSRRRYLGGCISPEDSAPGLESTVAVWDVFTVA